MGTFRDPSGIGPSDRHPGVSRDLRRQGLEIAERAYGPSPLVVLARPSLGGRMLRAGDTAAARRHLVAGREQAHRRVCRVVVDLGLPIRFARARSVLAHRIRRAPAGSAGACGTRS